MDAYTSPERSVWIVVVLAPILAGTIAALTNVTNFVVDRPAYFAIWGTAHLLAFGFGLWVALMWRGGRNPNAYRLLGLVAGAVEAFIVFGVLDGLVMVNTRFPEGAQLVTGIEDHIAAVSTIVLFTAGAMHGLRRRSDADAAPLERNSRTRLPTLPSGTRTEFLTAAGPVLTIAAGLLKELL